MIMSKYVPRSFNSIKRCYLQIWPFCVRPFFGTDLAKHDLLRTLLEGDVNRDELRNRHLKFLMPSIKAPDYGNHYLPLFLEDGRRTGARAFCECDLQFVNSVRALIPTFTDYDTSLCVLQSPGDATPACCLQKSKGLYTWFNKKRFECCDGNVVSVGSC